MTYEEIFAKSREIIMKSDVSGIDKRLAVEVRIIGEGEGTFYIALIDGVLSVEPYDYRDNDCRFIIKGKDFLKLAEGSLDPVAAFTQGKLKIEGSIEKALEFKEIVDRVHSKK